MSQLAVIESDAFDNIMKVAELYAEGVTSPHAIGRRLGIKVVEARAAIGQWQEMLRNDNDAKDVAKDALNVMLKRYDDLLVKANENLSNLEMLDFDEKVSAQINATIKNIGDLDAKRVDLLQKAGLLETGELGDEMAAMEERQAIIISILKEDLCDDCRIKIRDKMSRITGHVQGTVIDAEVVHET